MPPSKPLYPKKSTVYLLVSKVADGFYSVFSFFSSDQQTFRSKKKFPHGKTAMDSHRTPRWRLHFLALQQLREERKVKCNENKTQESRLTLNSSCTTSVWILYLSFLFKLLGRLLSFINMLAKIGVVSLFIHFNNSSSVRCNKNTNWSSTRSRGHSVPRMLLDREHLVYLFSGWSVFVNIYCYSWIPDIFDVFWLCISKRT